ncbi:M48 family metalloprotease [Streptomyces sp. MMBL 11-3]|uniref:M48 family metalloprotease n=1 Tax=Streptomyces sp. MMBL 11-3 TaxID=3382639 RepID=UPI0039B6E0CD
MDPAPAGRPRRRASAVPRTALPEPPPWLWLCLVLFVLQVPGLLGQASYRGSGLGEIDGAQRGRFVTAMLSLVQLLPLCFLLAAALALLAPWARCRYVERRYGLLPPDHPLMAPTRTGPDPGGTAVPHFHEQMTAVLNAYAPGTELRVSTRSGLFARVYPAGLRTARVGVFAPLVHLWHTDPRAARAVLVHELGHLRHGDQHVAGLGSPFTALVRRWPHVLAVLVVPPVTLLFVTGDATARPVLAQVVLVLCSLPAVLLLVVAALWSAELAADRVAVRDCGAQAVVRALRASQEGDRGGLARLHHPPVPLRVRFALRAWDPAAQSLLTLLWPLALLAKLLIAVLGAVAAYALLGARQDRIAGHVLGLAHASLTADPAWWATLAVVLLWPTATATATAARARARRRGTGTTFTTPAAATAPAAATVPAALSASAARAVRLPRPYALAALLPGLLLLLGTLPWGPRTTQDLFPDDRRNTHLSATAPERERPDATSTPCPGAGPPPAPARPPGLPTFGALPGASTGTAAAPLPDGARTFRTAAIVSAETLSGSPQWAQDFGDRLRATRWTLHPDGRLTADTARVPVLHSTAANTTTRLFDGRRTTRTGIGTTTTWMEARLVTDADAPPRLDLIRASVQALRVVADCRASTSTADTSMRLSLTLREQ